MRTIKWIAGFIIITAVAVGGIILNNQNGTENSTSEEFQDTENDTPAMSEIFVEYQEGGGFDIYEDGNRYGYKMVVAFNGDVVLYERIYRKGNGERSIEEVKINTGRLEETTFDTLMSSIEKSGFFEFPNRLPDVSPLEVEMRSPAKQVSISIRTKPDDELKTVRANLGADREHYPKEFFELSGELQKLMKQFNSKDD